MIGNPRIAEYLASLEPDCSPLLAQIEAKAKAERIPIVRRETGALLKTLIAAINPKSVLEIGTAVGYSSLLMAEVMMPNGRITTIESSEKRICAARENFRRAGKQEEITLLEGDAGERMKELPDCAYDLIFMDGAKGQYLHWLPQVLRLLSPGGLFISDNVLQDGDILESRFAVERRNRTIHSRMREYLFVLKHTRELETAVLPVGDGVAVSVKRRVKTEKEKR